MDDKNHYPKQESIPCHSLSRQVRMHAFQASAIESMPLAFQASGISTAPLVLHYTSTRSWMWTVSQMIINALCLFRRSMLYHVKKTIDSDKYLLCIHVIWSQTKQQLQLIFNKESPLGSSCTLKHWRSIGLSTTTWIGMEKCTRPWTAIPQLRLLQMCHTVQSSQAFTCIIHSRLWYRVCTHCGSDFIFGSNSDRKNDKMTR